MNDFKLVTEQPARARPAAGSGGAVTTATRLSPRGMASRSGVLAEIGEKLDEIEGLALTEVETAYLHAALRELTDREREVVLAVCGGGKNDVIAARLSIAVPTLRTHLMRLNQKLGSGSKGDVIRFVASALLQGYRSERIRPSQGGVPAMIVR